MKQQITVEGEVCEQTADNKRAGKRGGVDHREVQGFDAVGRGVSALVGDPWCGRGLGQDLAQDRIEKRAALFGGADAGLGAFQQTTIN